MPRKSATTHPLSPLQASSVHPLQVYKICHLHRFLRVCNGLRHFWSPRSAAGREFPSAQALARGRSRLNVCARPVSRDARRAATDAEGCHHHSRAEVDIPGGGGGAPSGVRARECPSGPLCCWPRTHQSVLHLSSNLRFDHASPPLHPLWGDKNCRVGNSRKSWKDSLVQPKVEPGFHSAFDILPSPYPVDSTLIYKG